jgi:hypothetical protein
MNIVNYALRATPAPAKPGLTDDQKVYIIARMPYESSRAIAKEINVPNKWVWEYTKHIKRVRKLNE